MVLSLSQNGSNLLTPGPLRLWCFFTLISNHTEVFFLALHHAWILITLTRA